MFKININKIFKATLNDQINIRYTLFELSRFIICYEMTKIRKHEATISLKLPYFTFTRVGNNSEEARTDRFESNKYNSLPLGRVGSLSLSLSLSLTNRGTSERKYLLTPRELHD